MLQNHKCAERVLLYAQHINTCLGHMHREKMSHEDSDLVKKNSASLCVSMGGSILKDSIPDGSQGGCKPALPQPGYSLLQEKSQLPTQESFTDPFSAKEPAHSPGYGLIFFFLLKSVLWQLVHIEDPCQKTVKDESHIQQFIWSLIFHHQFNVSRNVII